MNNVQAALTILGALVLLAGVGSAIWVYATGGAQDKRIERLQGERDDLLSRLNYIEPRFKSLGEQFATLQTLVDPSARLAEIRATVNAKTDEILTAVERSANNTDAIKAVLLAQARTLDEIDKRIHRDPG